MRMKEYPIKANVGRISRLETNTELWECIKE